MKKFYLAIDIGASSGRHIVGREEDGKIITEEIFRFPNGTKTQCGHLVSSACRDALFAPTVFKDFMSHIVQSHVAVLHPAF